MYQSPVRTLTIHMQLIIVLLLAPVGLAIKAIGCPDPNCPISYEGMTCAYDRVCGFEAENECQLQVEICLRELNDKPRFIKTVPGYCVEKNKRRCEPMAKRDFTDTEFV